MERLNRRGLVAFDRALENERTAAVDKTVGVGLELLAEFDRAERSEGYHAQRYSELAVFPEDVAVPIATIARLWGRVVEIDRDETEELLERLSGLALLQVLDLKAAEFDTFILQAHCAFDLTRHLKASRLQSKTIPIR
jgi:hypothetical protein